MIKFFLSAMLMGCFFTSCGNKSQVPENEHNDAEKTEIPAESLQTFGDKITQDGAIQASELLNRMDGSSSVSIKIAGVIDAVCQQKGCWMDIKIADNTIMKVRFKDYGFFIPKDATGKNVIFEGTAFNDTTSVEDLKHYAQDAGQTEEEINAITEPEIGVGFEANGVIIQ